MDGVEKERIEAQENTGHASSSQLRLDTEIVAEQWGRVLTTSDLAIIASDIKGTIELASPGAEKLFGYGPSELIGQHISILCPPVLRKDQRSKQKGMQVRGGVKVFETERLKSDGTIVPSEISHTLWVPRSRNGSAGQSLLCYRETDEIAIVIWSRNQA